MTFHDYAFTQFQHLPAYEITIIEEATASFGNGLYYKYVEIENSTFIFSNDLELESNGEMCVLFWLGENSQIVLATNVAR